MRQWAYLAKETGEDIHELELSVEIMRRKYIQ